MKKQFFQIAFLIFALGFFFQACHDPNKGTENNTNERIESKPPRRGDKNEIGVDSQRLGLDTLQQKNQSENHQGA